MIQHGGQKNKGPDCRIRAEREDNKRAGYKEYFTEQPYGLLVAVVTDFPPRSSVSA